MPGRRPGRPTFPGRPGPGPGAEDEPGAAQPGFQLAVAGLGLPPLAVEPQWVRGFIAFQPTRRTRIVVLMVPA